MDIVSELVLRALCAVHEISGYNPTIGELANVTMLSSGVVDRRLQRLIDGGYVCTDIQDEGRVRYRFMPTNEGIIFVSQKRRYS